MRNLSSSKRLSDFNFPWMTDLPKERDDHDQNSGPEDTSRPRVMDCEKADCAAKEPMIFFAKDLDVHQIAMKLLQDSWCIVKQLRLENWVEQVLKNSSATISAFHSYHENLCFSLFDFLRRFPSEGKKYRSVLEIVRRNDFFLYQSLLHAIKLIESGGQYERLNLDDNLITDTLRILFSRVDRSVLCKLKILEIRYQRYQTGFDMAKGRGFDVETRFLDSMLEDTANSVATQLSQDILRQFRRLSLESIFTHDQNIQVLGAQWNDLCHNAEEIACAGALQEKLVAVAKALLQLHNYFSLFSILLGMSAVGIQLEPDFAKLINSTENFRSYRTKWHVETSIPFLYPFIIDLRRGNTHALKGIFSFVDYDLRRE